MAERGSMTRLHVAAREGLLYAAMDGLAGVTDLYADSSVKPPLYGTVVTARVAQHLPGQGAAIVTWDSGGKRQEGYWHDAGKAPPVSGAMVRLQVKAAPRQGKLALLSLDIALTGRFLLHLPQSKGVKLSRRASKAVVVPDWLGHLPGGWVVRQGAAAVAGELLRHEADWLLRTAAHEYLPAPNCWQRAVTDCGAGLKELVFETEAGFAAANAWLRDFAPDLLPALKREADVLDWDSLLAQATAETVVLPDGGALTIQPTRAFWAVDVDAGAVQNHLQVNIQAARALARQMRLRNLGGIIVVDFISLRTASEREKLLTALRRVARDDPAGVEVFGLSRLGLAELTRSRRAPSLSEL